jgi:hypothetical protein
MKTRLARKLTYANVVSSICLFLLLGGGAAYAAAQLGTNSVGPKQLKKNAVTTAKIKNGAVTGAKIKASTVGTVPNATSAIIATNAANAAALGGQPPAAFQQRVRWALVDADGSILSQSGGITNLHDPFSCKPGCDFLDFGSSQAGKAVVVSGFLGGEAAVLRGAVCGDLPDSVGCVSGATPVNDPNHVIVRANAVGGGFADRAYYVAVFG